MNINSDPTPAATKAFIILYFRHLLCSNSNKSIIFYSLEDVRVHVRLVRLLVEPPHLLDLLPRPRRQDADERLLEAKVLFVLVDDVLQTLGIKPTNGK